MNLGADIQVGPGQIGKVLSSLTVLHYSRGISPFSTTTALGYGAMMSMPLWCPKPRIRQDEKTYRVDRWRGVFVKRASTCQGRPSQQDLSWSRRSLCRFCSAFLIHATTPRLRMRRWTRSQNGPWRIPMRIASLAT